MCHTPDDRYTPRQYAEATGDERATIHRWLKDVACMHTDTCTGCGAVHFICSSQCAEAFRQSHRDCDAKTAPAWLAAGAAYRDAARIPTDQPHAVAEYLRALLSRCTEYAHTSAGGPWTEVVPAERIRHALKHLTTQ